MANLVKLIRAAVETAREKTRAEESYYHVGFKHEQAEAFADEIERLTGWLTLIDGGDNPMEDPVLLRRFAFKALRGDEVGDG